jgi:hypothetical protein
MGHRIPADRPTRVFQATFNVRLPAVGPNMPWDAQPIYRSPVLDVKGQTLVNAYVAVIIRTDSAPAGAFQMRAQLSDDIQGIGIQTGQVVIDTQGVGQYGYRGPGEYAMGIIAATNALVGGVRWMLHAVSEQQRDLRIQLDGVLVAGGQRERT